MKNMWYEATRNAWISLQASRCLDFDSLSTPSVSPQYTEVSPKENPSLIILIRRAFDGAVIILWTTVVYS